MDTESGKPAERRQRRSIRLREYDDSRSGAYFVTICVRNRECLLGEIAGDAMLMNRYGLAVALTLEWLKQLFLCDLDEWIVMPYYVHAIILIDREDVGAVREPPVVGREKVKPLGSLVGAFKTVSSKKINQMRGTSGETVWQRNYYEHVLRSENELESIRSYVSLQPAGLAVRSGKPARAGRVRGRQKGRFANRPYGGPAWKTRVSKLASSSAPFR